VDVNAFARQHWQGGGHVHAAGGRSDLDLEATLTALRSTLSTWLAV
jgi:bifunctional oligoribonuclease and PAP phosphatase NrnA